MEEIMPKIAILKWMGITVLSAVLALTLTGCNNDGYTGTYSAGTTDVPDAPDTPDTPTVVAGDLQLTVTWTAVTGATAYEVWCGTTNDIEEAEQFGTQIYTNTSIITGLTNGTPYYVWVRAKNSGGSSEFSDPASGTPVAPISVPDAPEQPTLSKGYQKITATWTAVTGATGYEVWYGTEDNSDSAVQFNSDVTNASCVITGLTNGETYYVWLKAKNSAGDSGFSPSASIALDNAATHDAGDYETYGVGGVSFDMVYSQAVGGFPIGEDDSGTGAIAADYWIGETEVTYTLWSAVYNWATSSDRGSNIYSFGHPGMAGFDHYLGTTTSGHPVTYISWRDAMAWCNALTEYYNTANGTSYTCVYYTDAAYTAPIRTVTDDAAIYATPGAQDNPYVNESATGFRLPTCNEWEMAARYKGSDSSNGAILMSGLYWTPGSYASGATADMTDETATHAVGWFYENSSETTHLPGLKAANALGLVDMSGNAEEWCFEAYEPIMDSKALRGGGWRSFTDASMLGDYYYQDFAGGDTGFRFVRTQ